MEVSMDANAGVTHLSQQCSSTPSSLPDTRKRSLNDTDNHSAPSHPTSPPTITTTTTTQTPNQENDRPPTQTQDLHPPQPPSAEVPTNKPSNTVDAKPITGDRAIRVEIPLHSPHLETPLTAIPNPNTNPEGTSSAASAGTTGPAAKKRKLSPASREAKEQEKLARQVEKEARERAKAEEKTKREEERRAKEEEKKRKDAEKEEEKKKRDTEREEERKRREEKKKLKDEEKAAREEEKRKKEEEKLKKERAQTKLNSFFAKPKLPDQSPQKSTSVQNDSSQEPVATKSDYQREFPDFFLQSHTKLAPVHRFGRDSEAMHHMRSRIDACLKSGDNAMQETPRFSPPEIFRMMPYRRRRGRQEASVKDILLKIQNLGGALDAEGASEASVKLQDQLRKIPMKSLKFGEDVRPPYQGTYTKHLPESSANRLSRNPFYRGLPDTNYDYDSEAEWDDAEEGEDLDSEEEEEASEEGDDDMEGFLDDSDDQLADGKRRLIVGDLEPVCTGIRWQDNGVDPELQMYQMATIPESVTFPIDPFSTAYWQKPKADPAPAKNNTLGPFGFGNKSPRGSNQVPSDGGQTKAKRLIPTEHLDEFKQVVNGSDLSKMGLVEVLKKRFPKVSKEVLRGTLDSVAERVGQKEADKKWVCR